MKVKLFEDGPSISKFHLALDDAAGLNFEFLPVMKRLCQPIERPSNYRSFENEVSLGSEGSRSRIITSPKRYACGEGLQH